MIFYRFPVEKRHDSFIYFSLQKKEQFLSGKPPKKCWEELSKEMAQYKYKVTASQCASKLASLKRTYKNIKDHNSRSGNKRRNWQFYEVCCKLIMLMMLFNYLYLYQYISICY